MIPFHEPTARAHRRGGLEDSAAPIRDAAGSDLGVVLVFHDATEKRRAGEVLREAACRKDEFLALIGHELRNPLGPIRNAMHILGKTPQRDPTVERLRQVVTRQVTHMTRMVDDLLDVSRISRGPIPLQLELLDLVARFVIKVPLVQALRPIEHPVGGSPPNSFLRYEFRVDTELRTEQS